MSEAALEPSGLAGMAVGDLLTLAERLKTQSGLKAVIDLYEAWLGVNGEAPLAHVAYFNLGVACNEAGEQARAARAFRDGLRVSSDFPPLSINLGRSLEMLGQPGAAIEQWRRGLEHVAGVTGDAVANKTILLTQSARLLQEHMRHTTAEALLTEAINLEPDHEAAVREWLGLRTRLCRWPAISATPRVSAETQRSSVWPLTLAAISDDPMFQLVRAYVHARSEFAAPTRAELRAVAGARPPRNSRGRVKIGYLSSDLREHAVGHGIAEVFEAHDKQRFEIFAYYCGIDREDPIKARIRAASDHWLDISKLGDLEAATRIAEDGVDILVDLNGYTKFARTRVFAFRPAPAQVNWFGYPSTMGTPYHHYLIADETIIPRGQEIFYSEEVLRLPCYQPNDRKRRIAGEPPRRADYGLPDDAFVFCSFNATQKLRQRTFDLWLALLKAAPHTVLWLLQDLEETSNGLLAYARAAGVDPARIVIAPKLANAEHLARYPLADLFLDSFPWGAHTTASDALWMGVPVLTQTGRSFAARVCSSLVKAAGLPEFASADESEYAAKALAFAFQPETLRPYRGRLMDRRGQLFDVDRLVRALEGLYLEMVRREAQGRTPRPQLTNLDVYHEIGSKLDMEAINLLPREAWLKTWRDALADYDLHTPLGEDGRLWPGAHPTLAARRTAARG